MGTAPSAPLSDATQQLVDEWWESARDADTDGSAHATHRIFNERFVDELLADEPLATPSALSSTVEAALSKTERAEIGVAINQGCAAMDAGVRPRDKEAVVEQVRGQSGVATSSWHAAASARLTTTPHSP